MDSNVDLIQKPTFFPLLYASVTRDLAVEIVKEAIWKYFKENALCDTLTLLKVNLKMENMQTLYGFATLEHSN